MTDDPTESIGFGTEGRLQARAAFLGITMARLYEADQITASMARQIRQESGRITTGAYGLHTAVARALLAPAMRSTTDGDGRLPATAFDHIPARWVATGPAHVTFRFKDGSTLNLPRTARQ